MFSDAVEDPGAFQISTDHARHASGHGPKSSAEVQTLFAGILHMVKKSFTLVSPVYHEAKPFPVPSTLC